MQKVNNDYQMPQQIMILKEPDEPTDSVVTIATLIGIFMITCVAVIFTVIHAVFPPQVIIYDDLTQQCYVQSHK